MTAPANRLIHESSPYLLQHAHNPVDWYPWGDEAFRTAREQNKPIFLSIGYSACHWCHVMEHESFESEDVARVMNELFVNIKVDREERPDVDEVYMNAVQLMTGHGGWPMSLFLTPELEPFFGGTYFPPEDRHPMPGFKRVLVAAAHAYRDNPSGVKETIRQLREQLTSMGQAQDKNAVVGEPALYEAGRQILAQHDDRYGGFGRAPKFPHPDALTFLLRLFHATGEKRFLDSTLHTLKMMASGGIYDQLGGGFHRYSTDEHWLVPHFEKMLYDNALLPRVYLAAWQITGEGTFRRVAEETLEYLLREMRHPEGGFFSTQDADSEGEEGKYFVWSVAEIQRLMGPEKSALFCRFYGATDVGNFEGGNILHRLLTEEQLAKLHGASEDVVREVLMEGRRVLLQERTHRVPPGRDEKIILSWNGLMLSLLADGARVLGDPRWREAAKALVRFVHERLRSGGDYFHTTKDGEAKLPAFLDDHATWAEGLIDLYEATLDSSYLEEAQEVAESVLIRFLDRQDGGFFTSAVEHATPLLRTKPMYDGAVPSGNAVMAGVLLRLHHYFGNPAYLSEAERTLSLLAPGAHRYPLGHGRSLCSMDFHIRKPCEIHLVADGKDAGLAPLLRVIRQGFLPNLTLRVVTGSVGSDAPEAIRGKKAIDGKATAYVCHGFTCSPPATSPEQLADLLAPSYLRSTGADANMTR
ncbi:MAG: thioredoxin domain-containing protein [Nitrospirae bacterium]|nr:thioredoxin domain-containing protein [Nitrospirota bacterium]